jgi:hypothetical protein
VVLCGAVWYCVLLCGTVWYCVALRGIGNTVVLLPCHCTASTTSTAREDFGVVVRVVVGTTEYEMRKLNHPPIFTH